MTPKLSETSTCLIYKKKNEIHLKDTYKTCHTCFLTCQHVVIKNYLTIILSLKTNTLLYNHALKRLRTLDPATKSLEVFF